MIGAIAIRLGEAWAVAAVLQLALWCVQQRTRNAGVVDVGWAISFALVIGVLGLGAASPVAAWAPIAGVVALWSLRLSGYLISRGAARAPEDGRYVDLRQRWGERAARRFLVLFQAQAALAGVLSSAFVVPFVAAPWDTGWLRGAGVGIALVGIAGEATADAQLARWKRAAARGAVCDVGLWRYSRHPNYFFEYMVWIGYAVYGMAFIRDYGWIAIAGQALILTSIFKVTGIPATEAQALRSKGDAYKRYQEATSAFIPLPPRRT